MSNNRMSNNRMSNNNVKQQLSNNRMSNNRMSNIRMSNNRMSNNRMSNNRMSNNRMSNIRMSKGVALRQPYGLFEVLQRFRFEHFCDNLVPEFITFANVHVLFIVRPQTREAKRVFFIVRLFPIFSGYIFIQISNVQWTVVKHLSTCKPEVKLSSYRGTLIHLKHLEQIYTGKLIAIAIQEPDNI